MVEWLRQGATTIRELNRAGALAGARTSRPLIFEPRHASIGTEISLGGNVADETSALRDEVIPSSPGMEAW